MRKSVMPFLLVLFFLLAARVPAAVPTSGTLAPTAWSALYCKTPISSIQEGACRILNKDLATGKQTTGLHGEEWQMEIRAARDEKRVLAISPVKNPPPHPDWFPDMYAFVFSGLPILPDGEYRAALLENGKRISNVARIVIDSKFDSAKEPVVRTTTLPPWPDGSKLPLIAVQATGPKEEEGRLSAYADELELNVVVDGTSYGSGHSGSGSFIVGAYVHPGHVSLYNIIDPNPKPYDPASFYNVSVEVAPDKPHQFYIKAGKFQSAPMKLEYTGTMEKEWDAK